MRKSKSTSITERSYISNDMWRKAVLVYQNEQKITKDRWNNSNINLNSYGYLKETIFRKEAE